MLLIAVIENFTKYPYCLSLLIVPHSYMCGDKAILLVINYQICQIWLDNIVKDVGPFPLFALPFLNVLACFPIWLPLWS